MCLIKQRVCSTSAGRHILHPDTRTPPVTFPSSITLFYAVFSSQQAHWVGGGVCRMTALGDSSASF